MLDSLEKMLAKGVDNALLRFGLGKGYPGFSIPSSRASPLPQLECNLLWERRCDDSTSPR